MSRSSSPGRDWRRRRAPGGRGRAALALLALALPFRAPAQAPDSVELVGRVRAADERAVVGVRVFARSGGLADSAAVDTAGHFTLRLPGPRGAAVELSAVDADTVERFYPSLVRLPPGARTTGLSLVLVPRRWTISAGTHAGTVVDVSLRGATTPACRTCTPFYRGVQGDSMVGPPPGIPTWPEHAFPLRVAFDRIHGQRITPGDSVAFWRSAVEVERDLGRPLMRPATLDEVLDPDLDDRRGVALVFIDPSLRAEGVGSSAAQGGQIMASAMHFRSAALFSQPGGPHIVAHEITHALGFGHTCSWRSVLADTTRCPARSSRGLTPEDVAHIHLLWRVRALERRLGISTTISSALAGERAAGTAGPASPAPTLP